MPQTVSRFVSAILLVFALAPSVFAQNEEQKAAIQAVYKMSQEAKSLDELTAMIDECQRLLGTELSKSYQDYIKQLASWAYNRRGEVRSEDAGKQSDAAAAGELDAQALDDYNKAIELDTSRWKAYHNRGVSYAMQGEYEKALAEFDQALRYKPTYANTWFNRGEIHYEQGKYAEAISDYNNVLRFDSSDADAYTRRGHAYFKLGRYREALADYSRAVDRRPKDAMAYLNRGEAYLSLSQWPQAAQDYRQAITLDSSLGRAYQGAAWLMATCPDQRFLYPDRAVAAATKAIELVGEEADYRYYDTLAAAYAAARNFPKALETIAVALTKAPPDKENDLKERQGLYQQNRAYVIR